MNWFGMKLGASASDAVLGTKGNGVAGVGKYLDLKRSRDEPTGNSVLESPRETKKRKLVGFGDFEGW